MFSLLLLLLLLLLLTNLSFFFNARSYSFNASCLRIIVTLKLKFGPDLSLFFSPKIFRLYSVQVIRFTPLLLPPIWASYGQLKVRWVTRRRTVLFFFCFFVVVGFFFFLFLFFFYEMYTRSNSVFVEAYFLTSQYDARRV